MNHRSCLLRASAGFLAALAVAGPAPAEVQSGLPPSLRQVDYEQRLGADVPLDLTFRDEAGEPFPLQSAFRGRPLILVLAYYECPMLCTLVLNGLTSALRALPLDVGKEFDIVTVSIDPDETPALAAAKKERQIQSYGHPEAAAGWHFLTGEAAPIRSLADSVGFRYTFDPESGEFAHAAGIVVLTPAGRVARYFFGVEFSPRDLRLALVEASAGKLGSPVDRLLLYCYRYDPSTGRYTMMVMNVLRIAAAGTALGLGALVFVLRRREKLPAPRRQAAKPG